MPLHERRVSILGVEFESHILPTGKLFLIPFQEARFDITELSISSYILQVSRGESAYTAMLAFVSWSFRHNGFYARAVVAWGGCMATEAALSGN